MEQENTHSHAAKFAFFYMLSLVALVFVALATGMMIFQIINKFIVDVLEPFSGRFSDSALKFAISALIISAPIFYTLIWQIQKNLRQGTLARDSGVRRWLTYFILLVASVVMIGWLIGTLNAFFEGELTLKFALKALTAIGISATIFTFYLYDIRRQEISDKKDQAIQIYFYASLIVISAVFIWSLFLVESPTEARNRRFDEMVINDFSQLDSAINNYYRENSSMPESLEVLKNEFSYITEKELSDPINNTAYEYNITGEKEYELCATFRTGNQEEELEFRYVDKMWSHDAGEQCLKQRVHEAAKEVPMEQRLNLVD